MLTDILQPIDLFGQADPGIIQWIDNSLLYSTNFDDFLTALTKFLKQMIVKSLPLNITKCTFLTPELEWCGRRFSHTSKPTFDHELLLCLFADASG